MSDKGTVWFGFGTFCGALLAVLMMGLTLAIEGHVGHYEIENNEPIQIDESIYQCEEIFNINSLREPDNR